MRSIAFELFQLALTISLIWYFASSIHEPEWLLQWVDNLDRMKVRKWIFNLTVFAGATAVLWGGLPNVLPWITAKSNETSDWGGYITGVMAVWGAISMMRVGGALAGCQVELRKLREAVREREDAEAVRR